MSIFTGHIHQKEQRNFDIGCVQKQLRRLARRELLKEVEARAKRGRILAWAKIFLTQWQFDHIEYPRL